MSNLEWLEKAKKAEGKFIEGEDFEYRKTKALEIIAEELIGIKGELESIDEKFDGHFCVRIE